MLIYHHPTTVLLVDDDPLFLESFTFAYGDRFLCRATSDPHMAVRLVTDASPPTFGDLLSPRDGRSDDTLDGDGLLRLRLSDISRKAAEDRRFERISVVIVDYAMPSMIGLDLCRQLRSFHCKLLLLTGKAGQETAVTAFNEGLIDGFLTKQDPNLTTKLIDLIGKLQVAYFRSLTETCRAVASLSDMRFIEDGGFFNFFAHESKRRGWTEHYVVPQPHGLIALDEDGRAAVVIVNNAEAMTAQIEIAVAGAAPADLIEALRTGQFILCCPTPGGMYDPSLLHDWQRWLFPAQALPGGGWSVAVVPADALAELGVWLPSLSYSSYRRGRTRRI